MHVFTYIYFHVQLNSPTVCICHGTLFVVISLFTSITNNETCIASPKLVLKITCPGEDRVDPLANPSNVAALDPPY